jgi:hypothetical protein
VGIVTQQDFFRGFVAALRAEGLDYVDTRDDRHHRLFGAVVRRLERARRDARPGAQAMPRALLPNQITGRFQELDDALVDLQKGRLLGARNPFYHRVELAFTEENADQILDLYNAEEQELFRKLATAYTNEDAAVLR